MIVEDQGEVRAFLTDPRNLGQPGPVEVISTHISLIHLAGDRAWKLKRAVRLPYADFSTPALRRACCERELARNRLTAPDHYLAVRRITRTPEGLLEFDGKGPLVDAVVEMLRFDQPALLDALASRGGLDRGLMTGLAAEVADFHAKAPGVSDPPGSAHVAAVLDVNEAALAETKVFPAASVRSFNAAFRAGLDHYRGLLDARGRAGRVRLCHGDLHLRNIFLDRGRPVLFDCIEFNDALATVDVLYDLAFLLMDLRHRGLHGFANLVLNRYLDATGDEDGLPLIPFFMALRAAVRAHVTATRIDTGGDPDGRLTAEARAYFAMARDLLAPVPPVVVAIGGLSPAAARSLRARGLAEGLSHDYRPDRRAGQCRYDRDRGRGLRPPRRAAGGRGGGPIGRRAVPWRVAGACARGAAGAGGCPPRRAVGCGRGGAGTPARLRPRPEGVEPGRRGRQPRCGRRSDPAADAAGAAPPPGLSRAAAGAQFR